VCVCVCVLVQKKTYNTYKMNNGELFVVEQREYDEFMMCVCVMKMLWVGRGEVIFRNRGSFIDCSWFII